MNYPNWHAFIKMHMKANVFVNKYGNTIDFVSYNKFKNLNKYENRLLSQGNLALLDQLEMIKANGQNVQIQKAIIINELHSISREFNVSSEHAIHRRLKIQSQDKKLLEFDDLPDEIKNKISHFIEIQYSSIKSFISKFNVENSSSFKFKSPNNMYSLKWNGSKTNLTELIHVLYESGNVTKQNGLLTKKELFENMERFFNVDLRSWETTITKIANRDNPTRFLNQLEEKMSDYITKKLK